MFVFFQRFDHVERTQETGAHARQGLHLDAGSIVCSDFDFTAQPPFLHVPTNFARFNRDGMAMWNQPWRLLHGLNGCDRRGLSNVALGHVTLHDGQQGFRTKRDPTFGHGTTCHCGLPSNVHDALNLNRVLLSMWLHDPSPPSSTGGPAA